MERASVIARSIGFCAPVITIGPVSYTHLDVYKRQQDFFGEVEGVVGALLEGEAGVLAKVFQGDQVAVGKGMAFPHVDIDAAFQNWVEFQIELVEKFFKDFVVKVVQVKDADLAFEVFYVGDDVVGAGFVDGEFVFVHSELLHHFHEGIYCEGVVDVYKRQGRTFVIKLIISFLISFCQYKMKEIQRFPPRCV